jgi:hypothetical protein
MQKNVFGAGMAEPIDPRIARDLFRAIAPEDNLLLQIEHAYTDLQAVEGVAIDFRILKG